MQIGFHPETFEAKGQESQKQPSQRSIARTHCKAHKYYKIYFI